MAAQATVVLTDAESTPVNRSFIPKGIDSTGLATWEYVVSGGAYAGRNRLTMRLRPPVENSDAHKLTLVLEQPILEAVAGQTPAGYTPSPKVAYKLLTSIEAVFPARASLQERKNQWAMIKDLLAEAIVNTNAVETLEPVY
jgi:hypothetical protein